MTPKLGLAESIHSPGANMLAFLSDLEWKTTSVLHDPIVNTEETKDLVFSTRILSDTGLIANSPRLVYRKVLPTSKDSVGTVVNLSRVGTTDVYQYTLPAAQAQGDIWYYFQAQDVSGRTFSNPGKQLGGSQVWNHIQIGPDNVPPTIQFSPARSSIFSTTVADSLPIYARISDARTGISTAYVEYQINGVTQSTIPLTYNRLTIGNYTYDSIYVNRINFPANSLKVGIRLPTALSLRMHLAQKTKRLVHRQEPIYLRLRLLRLCVTSMSIRLMMQQRPVIFWALDSVLRPLPVSVMELFIQSTPTRTEMIFSHRAITSTSYCRRFG
ncbi:hypothetical protein [Spirosoma telluris]|uniref:hypothetical protein n=1 Tax=Spirosoma telluris TaxID=2183553 RepID=UPI002FC2F8C0